MALKLEQSAVHTVQLDGKEIKVVPIEQVNQLIEQGNTEITSVESEARKDERTKATREASKRIGVNLFDDKEVDKFLEDQKNKVDKTKYDEVQTQLESLKDIDKKYHDTLLDNTIIRKNVANEYHDKAKKLIDLEMKTTDGTTLEAATEKVLKEFPMFISKTRQVGIDLNGDPANMTGYERHVASNPNYKNNPYFNKNQE